MTGGVSGGMTGGSRAGAVSGSRFAWWACLLVLVAGCVTESTNTREPAPKGVKLQAHLDLARGYMEQRDWNRAKEPLERALEIEPKSAEAATLMAVLYQAQNEPDLAERWYQQALRNDPKFAMALNNYGTFLYSRGRYEDALKPLRSLVANPDYRERARAYESLGLTELKVGNRERATAAFERALSFNVIMPRSGLELAEISFEDGDYEAANSYYDLFRGRAKQTPRSLCLGIQLAREAGNDNQRASFEIALRNLYPKSAEATRCIEDR